MKRFIQGEHRSQSTLPTKSLDYVTDTNPVRLVEVAVDRGGLGRTEPINTHRDRQFRCQMLAGPVPACARLLDKLINDTGLNAPDYQKQLARIAAAGGLQGAPAVCLAKGFIQRPRRSQ